MYLPFGFSLNDSVVYEIKLLMSNAVRSRSLEDSFEDLIVERLLFFPGFGPVRVEKISLGIRWTFIQ